MKSGRCVALRAAPMFLAATLALGACGSDKENVDSSSGSTDSSTSGDGSGSGSAGGGEPAGVAPGPSPSAAPMGSSALPGVPAVTANATDFDKEPKLAKGTGSAPTELVIRDLIVGNGGVAVPTDSVQVRYEGALFTDGSVFDASWKYGKDPTGFALSGVVPGFAQGIVGMKVGGRREIVIPAPLGYAEQAQEGIPANSTLVFVVDLVSIDQ